MVGFVSRPFRPVEKFLLLFFCFCLPLLSSRSVDTARYGPWIFNCDVIFRIGAQAAIYHMTDGNQSLFAYRGSDVLNMNLLHSSAHNFQLLPTVSARTKRLSLIKFNAQEKEERVQQHEL